MLSLSSFKAGAKMSKKSSIKSSGHPEPFINELIEASRPSKTIRLRDLYNPSPPPERKTVAIRPPSPRPHPRPQPQPQPYSTATTECFSHRSFSCEPEPRAITRRRAHSLPSSDEKNTRRSSQVRFVDCLGLELEHVKFFRAGEDPKVPDHVINRLLASSELASGKHLELLLPFFRPFFPENLSAEPDFQVRLCHRRVCLEKVCCSELGITGTVQVNLAFEKHVSVRYSFTDWKSSAECKASWVSTVHRDDVQSDVFHFRLPVPPFILQPGASLEFAICYRVLGSEYWDNNEGHNYKLACHAYKLIVPKECEDSMVHFT
ncbi:Protein phosphatase 1 regulatory subunit 3D [Bagarius yarrelli]|uniref:Protein phosphatase 1 regulatory subunit 3D n=1 Tax=Bagarius yarrelli TaxID=175774 RepID=A0A556V966_BAGYA|nr:Protein phosphatase 1 regulatory subunit 3D [Bagarius yarrelli]